MGISGLLPVLKSITETKTLDEYRGRTLAIDGYCWLHRAIYSCSQEICLGQETDKYVTYFMDRIAALRHNGVTPYVVFDGGPLPMKKGTEEERRKSRQKNREMGIQHYNKRQFSEARKCFVRAADVSPAMAHRVIQHLKAQNVLYVVAPYEADAQLAYLVKNGLADGVITEDSDCLPFGCQTVLFKMDRDNVAQEIQMANLKKNKGLSFHMFTEQMFLEMCIFSGCDYLSSIPGFGLKKAYAAMKQHGSFMKIVRALRLEGKVRIPATYEDDFTKALLTFRHQRVYCPKTQQLVPLTPIPESLLDTDPTMDFVGPLLPSDIAKAIADGDMDPITMTQFPTQDRPLSHTSAQPKLIRPVAQALRKVAAPPRPKEAIASFFHARESAAAASFNAPRSRSEPERRKLPSSFMDNWTSRRVQPKVEESRDKVATMENTRDKVAAQSAAVSLLTSRFFGGNAKQALSLAESAKRDTASSIGSSSYTSQEPREVDVARSISFDPVKDKKLGQISAQADTVSKENQAPNSQDNPSSTAPAVKETAFSRMMRAGSMLQQHKLKKRKTLRSGFRSGTVLAQVPLSSRIERYAFSSKTDIVDRPRESRDPSLSEQTADESTSQLNEEPENEIPTLSEDDSAGPKPPVETETSETNADEVVDEVAVVEECPTVILAPSPVVSFDRFRFHH